MSFETVDADIKLETEEATHRETELIHRLHDIIQSEWPHHTRAKIESIKPSSGTNSSIIIQWNSSGDERLLGGYTDALLKHAWAITGLKNAMTFVAPVRQSTEEDVEFRFEGKSGEINQTYKPKECEVCGDREYVEHAEIEIDIDVEKRIEEGEWIPRYHYTFLRLCDECEVPDEYTVYEKEDGEPDFDPREHPEYDPFPDSEE